MKPDRPASAVGAKGEVSVAVLIYAAVQNSTNARPALGRDALNSALATDGVGGQARNGPPFFRRQSHDLHRRSFPGLAGTNVWLHALCGASCGNSGTARQH